MPLLVESLDARDLSGDEPSSIAAFERRLASAPFDLRMRRRWSVPGSSSWPRTSVASSSRDIISRRIAGRRACFWRSSRPHMRRFAPADSLSLPDLPIQYADYAVWARDRADQPSASAALAAVIQALDGASPVSLVPVSNVRSTRNGADAPGVDSPLMP